MRHYATGASGGGQGGREGERTRRASFARLALTVSRGREGKRGGRANDRKTRRHINAITVPREINFDERANNGCRVLVSRLSRLDRDD